MIRQFTTILIFVFFINQGFAQEILTGLQENPQLKKAAKSHKQDLIPKTYKSSKLEIPKPLNLPFFEDFKQKGFYPDTAKWMDNYVFVNQDFPLFPPSWGAATFDAINQYGDLYGNANPLQFFADQLTSKPIRLDSIFDPAPQALSPADSLYLSFYYQPQGVGNDPQPQDSLMLQFGWYTGDFVFDRVDSTAIPVDLYGVDTIFPGDTLITPCDPNWGYRVLDTLFSGDTVVLPCDSVFVPETQWQRAWSSRGMTLDTFRLMNDTFYFKQVFVPILDTALFRSDFQFRFFNYASISNDNLQSWQSNCDYWNVDYIVLDRNRTREDTTHQDITFVGRAPSFLSRYQSMPFYQYSNDPTNELKLGIRNYISNLDDGNQTAIYGYNVYNDIGGQEFSWDGGSGDLVPFYQSGYSNIPPFAVPPVSDAFPPFGNRDSIYFDIVHHLVGDQALGLSDTITFRQEFYNYYAYDDGTPEFGYGLTPGGAQLAYRFDLNRRDTLRAVKFYFNKTLTGANDRFFNLVVWNDLDGIPGDIIHIQERERPAFGDSLYRYHTYHLDSALPVQGTFYVGWIQITGHNLNLGFDANNDARQNIFYNVTGNEWVRSSYRGALMIRPVLGKPLRENEPVATKASMDLFRIAPNPSHDGMISLKFLHYPGHSPYPEFINLEDEVLQQMEVYVFNMMGQAVYSGRYQSMINLSFLNDGIYVVRLIDPVNQASMSQKLLIRN